MAPAKDPRRCNSLEQYLALFYAEHCTLSQSDHRRIGLFEELIYPFLLSFTHMCRIGIRVQIVWADLKADERQSVKRRRLHYRHILRRFERRARDNRTGARSNVGNAFSYLPANWCQQVKVIKPFQQTKGIATSDEHSFGCFYCLLRVRGFMNGVERISHRFHALVYQCGISVAVVLRKGHEQKTINRAKKISYLLFSVVKITAPVKRRITDQQ